MQASAIPVDMDKRGMGLYIPATPQWQSDKKGWPEGGMDLHVEA